MNFNQLKTIRFEKIIKPMMPIANWCFRLSPGMVTCREFNAFVLDYTEGLLTDRQSVLFERHMRFCPMCRSFLKTYIASYKAVKAYRLDDFELLEDVPQELLDAISEVLGER